MLVVLYIPHRATQEASRLTDPSLLQVVGRKTRDCRSLQTCPGVTLRTDATERYHYFNVGLLTSARLRGLGRRVPYSPSNLRVNRYSWVKHLADKFEVDESVSCRGLLPSSDDQTNGVSSV